MKRLIQLAPRLSGVGAALFAGSALAAQMYLNPLAGDTTIDKATYGAVTADAEAGIEAYAGLTLPAPIAATSFSSRGDIPTTSPGISGAFTEMLGNDGTSRYVATHTVAGWFKVASLPTTSGSYTFLWIARNDMYDGDFAGYGVAVDPDGKLMVGRYNSRANTLRDDLTSSTVERRLITTDGVMSRNTWTHIAVSFSSSVSSNTYTTTVKVFVNGVEKSLKTNTSFKSNLNGTRKCQAVQLGTGVSAAGFYVDGTAITNAETIRSLAVSPAKNIYVDKWTRRVPGNGGWHPTTAENYYWSGENVNASAVQPLVYRGEVTLSVTATEASTLSLNASPSLTALTTDYGTGGTAVLTLASGSNTLTAATTTISAKTVLDGTGFSLGNLSITPTGTLTVGDNRTNFTVTSIAEDGKLIVTPTETEIAARRITFNVDESVTLSTENVEVTGYNTFTVDGGTITLPIPTWTPTTGDTSWANNWSATPSNGGTAILDLSHLTAARTVTIPASVNLGTTSIIGASESVPVTIESGARLGTLTVLNRATLPAAIPATSVILETGAVLSLTGEGTLSAAVSGAGTLKKVGTGTLSLTGAVSAPVELAEGTLSLGTLRPAVTMTGENTALQLTATREEAVAGRITLSSISVAHAGDCTLLITDPYGKTATGTVEGSTVIFTPTAFERTLSGGTVNWKEVGSWSDTSVVAPGVGAGVKLILTADTTVILPAATDFAAPGIVTVEGAYQLTFQLPASGTTPVFTANLVANDAGTTIAAPYSAIAPAKITGACQVVVLVAEDVTINAFGSLTPASSGQFKVKTLADKTLTLSQSGEITPDTKFAGIGGEGNVSAALCLNFPNAFNGREIELFGNITFTSDSAGINAGHGETQTRMTIRQTAGTVSGGRIRTAAYSEEKGHGCTYIIDGGTCATTMLKHFATDTGYFTIQVNAGGTLSGPLKKGERTGNTHKIILNGGEFTSTMIQENATVQIESGDYTIGGTGDKALAVLPVSTKVTLNGGSLTVATSQTLTGALTGSGALVVGDGATTSSLTLSSLGIVADEVATHAGSIEVKENGALTLKNAVATTLNGAVTGEGSLTIGDGTTATQVTLAGTLGTVTDGSATVASPITIAANATLTLASTTSTTLNSAVTGAGTLAIGDGTTASSVTLNGTLGTVTGKGESAQATCALALEVAAASELRLTPTLATTLTSAITGAGDVVIGDGTAASTVKLTEACSYTGTTTIAKNAILLLGSGADNLSASATAKVVVNGLLQAAANEVSYYRPTEGSGVIYVPSSTTLIIGQMQGPVAEDGPGKTGLTGFTGTLKIAGTFEPRNWCTNSNPAYTYTVTGCDVVFEGDRAAIKKTQGGAALVEIAAGKKVSGGATMSVPLAFQAEAVIETGYVGIRLDGVALTMPQGDRERVLVKATTAKGSSGFLTVSTEYAPADMSGFDFAEGSALTKENACLNRALLSWASGVTAYLQVLPKPTLSTSAAGVADAILAQTIANPLPGNIPQPIASVKVADKARMVLEGALFFENVVETVYELQGDGDQSTYGYTAKVTYDFGVSAITVKRLTLADTPELCVVVCAKVESTAVSGTAATFKESAQVQLYLDDKLCDGTKGNGPAATTLTDVQLRALGITPAAGEKWFAVPMAKLNSGTNAFTVSASQTTQEEVTP